MRNLILLTAVAVLTPYTASAQSLYQQELEKIRSRNSSSYDSSPLYGDSSNSSSYSCVGYGCYDDRDKDRSRYDRSTPELENSFSRSGVPKNSLGNNILDQLQPR